MIEPVIIDHSKYDKISDDILWLSDNCVLRVNVALARNNETYGRTSYHREFEYTNNKGERLITMRRSFDYFLTLENAKVSDSGEKAYVQIRSENMILVQNVFNQIVKWFTSSEYDNLYGKQNNTLVLLKRLEPVIITELPMQKYISIEPAIVYNNRTETDSTGIRIYLSSEKNYVNITVDKLMGLIYHLNTMNLYQSAQEMVNYLQRPEFGTNLYSFEKGQVENFEDKNDLITGKTGRIVNTRNKSFFDK